MLGLCHVLRKNAIGCPFEALSMMIIDDVNNEYNKRVVNKMTTILMLQ